MTNPTDNTPLRDDALSLLDRLDRASTECQERLEQAGQPLARDWMFALREALRDMKEMVRRLVDVYGAAPDAAPEAMKRFIEYALYGVGPHLQQHFTEIEQQLDLIFPEPEDPEDGGAPTR